MGWKNGQNSSETDQHHKPKAKPTHRKQNRSEKSTKMLGKNVVQKKKKMLIYRELGLTSDCDVRRFNTIPSIICFLIHLRPNQRWHIHRKHARYSSCCRPNAPHSEQVNNLEGKLSFPARFVFVCALMFSWLHRIPLSCCRLVWYAVCKYSYGALRSGLQVAVQHAQHGGDIYMLVLLSPSKSVKKVTWYEYTTKYFSRGSYSPRNTKGSRSFVTLHYTRVRTGWYQHVFFFFV